MKPTSYAKVNIMREPKFKVGDKVKVMRASTDEEYDLWRDVWMPEMGDVIGEICIIGYCNPNGHWDSNDLYPKYTLDKCGLNFPEFVLQKVNEVGKQLLFDFMTP